jgi:hypothetical protein
MKLGLTVESRGAVAPADLARVAAAIQVQSFYTPIHAANEGERISYSVAGNVTAPYGLAPGGSITFLARAPSPRERITLNLVESSFREQTISGAPMICDPDVLAPCALSTGEATGDRSVTGRTK